MATAAEGAELILPPHIEETVKSIAALHAQHQRRSTPVQRFVAKSVQLIGQPRSIALLALLLIVWVGANIALERYGRAFDPAPFEYLNDLGTAASVFITILILITQRREDELTHLREQLTLELAILSEQKNAKIICLIEEMRRDNPLIENRSDPEAEALSVPADPQAVLEALIVSQENALAEDAGASEPPLPL